MKTIKVKFLGSDYEINCEENEISKIRNLESRLKDRIRKSEKFGHNFSDTHKLLLISLQLEDKIDELIATKKILLNKVEQNNLENEKLLKEYEKSNYELNEQLKLIRNKIKSITDNVKKNSND